MNSENAGWLRMGCKAFLMSHLLVVGFGLFAAFFVLSSKSNESERYAAIGVIVGLVSSLPPTLMIVFAGLCLADIHTHFRKQAAGPPPKLATRRVSTTARDSAADGWLQDEQG